MPRGVPGIGASKPHARAAEKRVLSLDEIWAAQIERALVADAHPSQKDAITDPARRLSFLVGRGGGKTTTMRARALIKMTAKRNARIVYIATTRPAAEEINWGPLKDLIDKLGLTEEFVFHESKLKCTCKRTGSTYRLVGADDKREIEKLRGQPFDEVQIDESASHDPKLLEFLIFRIIAPRLGERNGVLVMAGTPGHILRGPFYDASRPGSELHRPYSQRALVEFKGWSKWSSHKWTLKDVADMPNAERAFPALFRLWREALIEKATNGWGDDNPVWRREYLGEWAADDTDTMYKYRPHLEDGTPWNQWDPERIGARGDNVTGFARLPEGVKDWLFGYGMDLGSRDPFALNVFALSASDPERKIRHVFGFERRQMYARLIAELLVGKDAVERVIRGDGLPDKLGGLFGLTGWPTAIVADLAGLGETLIDELANVYGIQIKAAEKAGKHGAIEVTNGQLIDGRLMILKGSPLEQQLGALQWKPDEYGQPKEDKAAANHSSDSLIYIAPELLPLFSGVQTTRPADQRSHELFFDPQGLSDDVREPDEPGDSAPDEFSFLASGDEYGDLFGNG